MKKSKKMLKKIISNQELIMKALEIEIPTEENKKEGAKKTPAKKAVVKKSVNNKAKK